MQLAVTGDIHGDLNFKRIYQAKKLKITDLLICGDFGYIWDGSRKEQRRLDYLNKIGVRCLFIDGNHENHKLLNEYPVTEMFGGKVHKIRDNIIHLMRGDIYTIDNKTFLCIGGANSTDKKYRTEGKNWWPEENVTYSDIENALNNLKKHGYKVDYILTHTCYNTALKNMNAEYRLDNISDYFQDLYEFIVSYKEWYFGHMHENVGVGNDTHCLYNRIVKL